MSGEIADPVGRVGPTRRPAGPAMGSQRWRTLAFLHWEVPVEALRPLLPPGLEVDTYEGRAYVGLVPFTMRDVRPLRALPPMPGAAHFHETNVRTYVLHGGRSPGVWFFSLDAASRLAVWGARTLFHLPYHLARMELTVDGDAVGYRSERAGGAGLQLRYRVGAQLPPSVPGSLQFFLAERYYLYATADGPERRSGRLLRGQVHHAPYPLHAATVESLDESLLAAAGLPRGGPRPPDLYSPGVDVEIFALERL